MDRLLRTLGIGVTLALVVYAAVLLLGDSEADEVVEGVIADAENAQNAERDPAAIARARQTMRMVGQGLAMSPDDEAPISEAVSSEAPIASVPYGSGEIDETTARDGFDYAMRKVARVVNSRRRLTVEEWDALYRETNDAFSALSIVLDATDEAQQAELEKAHKKLQQGLRKVRVRGRKFSPR